MQPSEPSSTGEDSFSAFESGTSEYASAESNLEEPNAGMEETEGTTMPTTSTNNDDDDFFDAFVDADDGIKSAEDDGAFASRFSVAAGEVLEDNVGQASSSSSSVQPEAVDLFSIATTSESANQPASTHEEKPNSGINNNSHPEEELDLFGAFNDTNIEQPDIGTNASSSVAPKNDDAGESNIPAADDFFGAFGAVSETESPPMTAESFSAPVKLGEKIIDEEDDNMNKISDGSSNASIDATETLPANLTAGDCFDCVPSTQKEPESQGSEGHEAASGDPSAFLEGGDNNGGSVDFTEDNDAVIGVKNEANGIHASGGIGELNGAVQNDDIDGGAVIASESIAGNDIENEPGVSSSGDDAQFRENGEDNSSSDIQGILSAPDSRINDDSRAFESPNEIESGDLLGASALAGSGGDKLEVGAQALNSTLDRSVDNDETVRYPSGGNDAFVDTSEKHLESATSNEDADDDGKDFGEFSVFSSEATGALRDTPSGLDLANVEVSEQYAAPHSSDNFGGFGSFEAVPPVAESTEYETSTQDDSFGGFASVEESPEKPRALASEEASAVSVVENSDKDSANPLDSDAIAHALESNLEVKGTVSEINAFDSHVSGNSGNFGGFSSFEEEVPPDTEPRKDGAVSPNAENEEDADFGGFNAFEEAPTNQPSPVSVKSAGDDGSGSFDAFSTEAPGVNSTDAPTAEADDPTGQPMAGVDDAADDEFGDFGDFDAVKDTPEESSPVDDPVESDRVMLNPAEEEAPLGQPSAAVTSADDEFGGFDDFNAFEGTPDEASPDSAQKESDKRAPTPTAEEAAASQPFAAVSSTDYADDEFGDFGDFDAFEEATPDVAQTESDDNASPAGEEGVPASQPSAVASPVDDEFGDFGGFDAFEEAPEDVSPADTAETGSDKKSTIPAKEKIIEPSATASPADGADDDFGEFGDFDAFEEASPDMAQTESDEKAPTPAEEEAAVSQPSEVVSSANVADDEFGDFGEFDAVEEAPEDVSPGDIAPTESDQKATTPAEEKAPEPSAVASPADGDDFGDFQEIEGTPAEEAPPADASPTESVKRDLPTVTESAPKPALLILNESVRVMFHGVFTSKTPSTSDLDGKGTCPELPFDIPMRKILPGPVSTEEKEASAPSHNQSERELVLMKTHFQDLPRSSPITILSDEKWYPYSQYEFHRDGSPYADTVELATTPSVPEVLSIDLPTGFEATNLTPSPSSSKPRPGTPPPSSNRTTPTVVDFPTTPTNNVSTVVDLPSKRKNKEREIKSVTEAKQDSKESEEMDHSQLSAIGKQFMQQLPDLSYMLKSTLSLPNGDK